ncbi:hypothetical protein M9458_002502, partial [Cirrhinus mrigala]
VGLNDPIRSDLPGGKIHWSLEQYIDYAMLLAGSSFTVGIADDKPCHSPVSATPKNSYVMSSIVTIMPEPPHAKPAKPKGAHAMPATPGPAHVMAALPESAPVMAAIP